MSDITKGFLIATGVLLAVLVVGTAAGVFNKLI